MWGSNEPLIVMTFPHPVKSNAASGRLSVLCDIALIFSEKADILLLVVVINVFKTV